MKLYKLSRPTENIEYDTFDSFVACAPDENTARNMCPRNGKQMDWNPEDNYDWAKSPEAVKVEYLGEADPSVKPGVICSSFNAG